METTVRCENLRKKLSTYSLVAGAGVFASAGALGAPVDAGVSGQATMGPDSTDGFEFDVSGDGENDFRIGGEYFSGSECGYIRLNGIFRDGMRWGDVAVDPDFQFGGYAALIAEGASVGDTLEYRSGGTLFGSCTDNGFFPPITRGFVGLRVPVPGNQVGAAGDGERTEGDFRYAYADIEVTGTPDGGLTATIFNVFRESELNEPITTPERAPATPAIPVPVGGAVPLGLLLLAAGGLALRRRQQGLSTD